MLMAIIGGAAMPAAMRIARTRTHAAIAIAAADIPSATDGYQILSYSAVTDADAQLAKLESVVGAATNNATTAE